MKFIIKIKGVIIKIKISDKNKNKPVTFLPGHPALRYLAINIPNVAHSNHAAAINEPGVLFCNDYLC